MFPYNAEFLLFVNEVVIFDTKMERNYYIQIDN